MCVKYLTHNILEMIKTDLIKGAFTLDGSLAEEI